MQALENEKVRPVRQHQTDRTEKPITESIPQGAMCENHAKRNSIGRDKFRRYLEGVLLALNAREIIR